SVEPSCASSVPIDASVLHDNNAYIPHDLLVTELGAQNPFYLRKAKVAQPALYDGDEILKTHHVPVSVTSSEEDLEIAEITRKKMNEKMNDPVCVEKRIKIIPPNYSKENFLATFTPQTQLTPEQVFWSNDLLKQRFEALKVNSLPLPILSPVTVYPPSTPVHLVPRMLPTTSQVNIGEMGFEQIKQCYLTEVIPFFNLLKEHFEEVQRSLVKEVRAMKAVFENMKAEVDQNATDKKCREIERKNLLITNANLIANCIAQDVFYTVTDSALSASRFHDLSTAYNVAMTRVVELEFENSKLPHKIQHDSHDTMVKDFLKLEVAHLNLQLKYQHLKENIENFKSKSSKDVPEFDTFFELGIRDDHIQGHRNTIRKLKAQIYQFKANKSDELRTLDYKSLDSQNFQLNETVTALQEQLDHFKAENEKVKQHYQELFNSVKVTRVKTFERTTSLQTEIRNLKTQLKGKMPCVTNNVVTPKVFAIVKYAIEDESIPASLKNNRNIHHHYLNRLRDILDTLCEIVKQGVRKATKARRSKSKSNIINDKTLLANSVPKKKGKDHHRKNKSKLSKKNRVDSSTNVVQIILWYLDSGCSKHMTGDRSRLRNFMKKFIGIVRFRNDHFGVIIGYGDYVIGDSVIFRVYYVEGLGHNLFSVGQFCDSDLEVAFRKHICFVRDLDGVDLIKAYRGTNLYTISVEDMMRSSPICLLSKALKNKSWLWHRCLNHLNFGTLNDLARKDLVRGLPRLKFEKDHLPMRVQSINGKKYILVIVDDHSRFTWVKFLRSKDETSEFIVKLIKQLQVGLNRIVKNVRTDNGTEFVNKDLTAYDESVDITHEKTVLRTPQQNGVVERRNRTLIEAARTMLIISKAPMFLWEEVISTACYTQN
ncbi:retrovirus-related pol polyprotein from transposon TNT 1-94, partial [Tanacetum coccineum]